jgi:hypothetical protein
VPGRTNLDAPAPDNWDAVSATVSGRRHARLSVFFENFVRGSAVQQTQTGEVRAENEAVLDRLPKLESLVSFLADTK